MIDNLNMNKACQNSDSPPKIIKISKDCSIISHWLLILLIARCIYENVSYCTDKVEFPNYLKHAVIVPMHKKKDKTDKVNDRLVSIPSTFSKLYKKLMSKYTIALIYKISTFWDYITFKPMLISKNIWYWALSEAFHNKIKFGVILNNLSKAFDSTDHSLLLLILYWYGKSHTLLKMIFSYFENQTHRTKTSKCFTNTAKVKYGIRLGSILFPHKSYRYVLWMWRFWHWKLYWWHYALHLCSLYSPHLISILLNRI